VTQKTANGRLSFYRHALVQWVRGKDSTILVVGGSENDRDVFRELGFRNVTISNVATALARADCAPFQTAVADAEALPFPDGAFDYTVCHAVLHHCRSPHAGLLELYRVASKAAIVFESRDSLTIRLMGRLGLSQVYEWGAVVSNGCEAGGMRDTQIPNFVYRWTEREVEKTVATYAPHARHRIEYARGNAAPLHATSGWSLKSLMFRLLIPVYRLFVMLFPSQQNMFAFKIEKPTLPNDLQPWLTMAGGEVVFDRKWAETHPSRRDDEA
jgi:SAM-dependent methyltransferase